jgi:hypothetical protein
MPPTTLRAEDLFATTGATVEDFLKFAHTCGRILRCLALPPPVLEVGKDGGWRLAWQSRRNYRDGSCADGAPLIQSEE